jgi:hypothetical protein
MPPLGGHIVGRVVVCVSLAVALPTALSAQGTVSVPSDTLVAGITERGRLLAAYDQATWHATDALLAIHPDSTARSMVAHRLADGRWTVLFGRLTEAADTLYLMYEALPTERPDSFVMRTLARPRALAGPERLAAAALQTAREDFGAQQRPYNSYVLPRPDSAFWVYFLPAQTDYREFPHGADIRYLVAADGRRILDKHPMHRALLNLAVPDSAVFGYHTVLVDDVPQDSDVFLVLTRRPRKHEFIATAHYNYEIALDGSIGWERADRDK